MPPETRTSLISLSGSITVVHSFPTLPRPRDGLGFSGFGPGSGGLTRVGVWARHPGGRPEQAGSSQTSPRQTGSYSTTYMKTSDDLNQPIRVNPPAPGDNRKTLVRPIVFAVAKIYV